MEQTFSWQSPRLVGRYQPPSDKSISHRAFILGALAHGDTVIHHALNSADVNATRQMITTLGVDIVKHGRDEIVKGQGRDSWKDETVLDALNSGTTMRLMTGALASGTGRYTLTGDASLSQRPMRRVTQPLQEMGAAIQTTDGHAPLYIESQPLHGVTYHMPVASAQVKSALILAGLQAESETVIVEKHPTRNHTETMLPRFGGKLDVHDFTITVPPKQRLYGAEVTVPSDLSSAAFFIAAALLIPNSDLVVENVGLNPTRTGFLTALQKMGATYDMIEHVGGFEPYGTLHFRHQNLKACTLGGADIPLLIDELPLIALLATQAEGTTVIRDAHELAVKETNRLTATADVLNTLGAHVEVLEDGWRITGPTPLHGGVVKSYHDHRIAMMATIASLLTKETVSIQDYEAVAVSYPHFLTDLKPLIQ